MSADDDTELRDLVAQTLETKGVLGKIRAQLRASVFLALEEQEGSALEKDGKVPLVNSHLKDFLNTSEGRLVTGLVREFLEFFDLDFSIAVFDPESNFSDMYPGRNNLAKELNMSESDSISGKPLIAELVHRFSSGETTAGKAPKEVSSPLMSPRQDSPASPRSISPSPGKVLKSSEAQNVWDQDMEDDEFMGGAKPSKIPQRIRDDKSRSEHSRASDIGDSFFDKLDSLKDRNGKGSPDLTLGSDEEDIFADSPRKPKTTESAGFKARLNDGDKKPQSALDSGPNLSSLRGAPPLGGMGTTGLGSLKGAPPLPGTTNRDLAKSPDWKDLADIDDRISKLGFEIPADDKSTHSREYNEDDYESDFQPSSEHTLSIPEEIDEQLSISSYHSGSTKLDDLLTTDRTVSQASVHDLDYAEDVLEF